MMRVGGGGNWLRIMSNYGAEFSGCTISAKGMEYKLEEINKIK
jgi:hypothetical protein